MDYNKDQVAGQSYKNKVNVISPKSVEMDTMANGRIPSYLSYQNNNVVSVTDVLKNYPIPPFYIQFTDTSGNFVDSMDPTYYYNNTFKLNTNWKILFNGDSVFFRTEGSYSNSDRSGGIQTNAILNATGNLSFSHLYANSVNTVGVFTKKVGNYDDWTDIGASRRQNVVTELNLSRQLPISNEIRPRNRLIRVYQLTSINGQPIE